MGDLPLLYAGDWQVILAFRVAPAASHGAVGGSEIVARLVLSRFVGIDGLHTIDRIGHIFPGE